ncbi:MAG: DUF3301 domain-containing protein [Betaproteobacteria bacterium]|nr:DUF3301 domain-containing protein [Betaproteobacteria bacterium]
MTWELLLLGLLLGAGWVWWDGLQKREIALTIARRLCAQSEVQFLDDSVALHRMTLRRDDFQRVRLYREFSFDYSSLGDDRHPGRVYLLGDRVLGASLIQPR